MRPKCVFCGHYFNLGNRSTDDYSGPVKCFCCGAMNELKMVTGIVYSINPLAVFDNDPRETFIEAKASSRRGGTGMQGPSAPEPSG